MTVEVRPRLRGVLHRAVTPIFALGFAYLVSRAPTPGQAVAMVVYGLGVTAMLGVSATYHSAKRSPRAKAILRRFDHSTILLAIAGSYTGVTTLATHGTTRVVLLILVWVVATIGVVVRLVWLDAPDGVVALVYLVIGWFMLVDPLAYIHGMTGGQFALVAVGGGLYTVGAVVYGTSKPNPWPDWFGFHEIFHTFVVAAAACHYAVMYRLLTR